jgi:hypothetical protein
MARLEGPFEAYEPESILERFRRMAHVSRSQRAANRRNAKRSTGPRTQKGKYRASNNAYRHGLAVIAAEPSAEVRRLAEAIAPVDSPETWKCKALIIAECTILLRKIHLIRIGILESAVSYPAMLELACLERYERRALSRRKRALSSFSHSISNGVSICESNF